MKGCAEKVWGKLDGTSRWNGFRECQGKIVVTTANGKYSYCKRHAHRATEYDKAIEAKS